MIYTFDEVNQKRRRVQHTADVRVFLHQRIGVIIPLAAFVDILRERHEQRRGISLLHQIPQMHQPCHSAVAVKVRMQIRHVEVDQRRFQQIVDLGFFMDKGDQFAHAFRQRLPGKARMLHLCADHIHAVMPVEMTGQQPILLG